MPQLSRTQKKRITAFFVGALAAWVVSLISQPLTYLADASSIPYMGIILAWALTARRRIVQTNIRRLLILASSLMAFLFLLRQCRYSYFEHSPMIVRYLWYSYYIPLTAVPLSAYLTALCVGKPGADRPLRRAKYLWVFEALLCVAILTNDLHQWAFHIIDRTSGIYTYGWLYYAVVAWSVLFTLAAFMELLKRSRVSAVRSLWYIPVIPSVLAAALLIVYFAVGGSPMVHGFKLYNFQEIFCFLYVVLFEACIQIGLIPSNSGYDELFLFSHINAAIGDSAGEMVYQSRNYTPDVEDENIRSRSKAISGGEIVWIEDMTAIKRLNDDLQEAVETIAAENTLLEKENEGKQRTARIETRSRLYDEIALSVRPQLERLDALLENAERGGKIDREKLALASVLGAYIKRHSNLVLNADLSSAMSSNDLYFAIKETAEYLELTGLRCALRAQGEKNLSSALVILTYECFEAVIEAVQPAAHAVMVDLSAADAFRMTVIADVPDIGLDEEWKQSELAALGGCLSVFRDPDSVRVRLYAGEGENV